MQIIPENIFSGIPDAVPEELFQTLLQQDNLHIERIISKGHVTPKGEWYDQDWDEWVMLLQGKATLLFEGGNPVNLIPGEYLLISAHSRHRVEWTDPDVETIWLAIHLK